MKQYVESQRETWEMFGCTIMCDGWTGPIKLAIINFMVYAKGSTIFLKSVNTSNMKKTAQYIYSLLDGIIKEVGPENIVQIVTDNASAFKNAGRELEKRYNLYWTMCAAHCIDLIFEDIGKEHVVANVIKQAREVTNYIYNHGWLLAEMRDITHANLIRPGKTRFATNHIAISSMLKNKAGLKKLFVSDAWHENDLSRKVDGRLVERRVFDSNFWHGINGNNAYYLQAFI